MKLLLQLTGRRGCLLWRRTINLASIYMLCRLLVLALSDCSIASFYVVNDFSSMSGLQINGGID